MQSPRQYYFIKRVSLSQSVQLLIKNQKSLHILNYWFRCDIELTQSPAYSVVIQKDESVTSVTAASMKDQLIYDYIQTPLPNVCSSEYEILEIYDK